MKRLITTTIVAAAFAVLPMVATAKAPARAATAHLVMCQGIAAYTTDNDYVGGNRSEYQLAFGMRLDQSKQVMVAGVQGTTIIKPGKYLASPSGDGFGIDLTWIDRRNQSRFMVLQFNKDGTFSGATDPAVISTPGQSLACAILSDLCQVAQIRSTISISGACMDAE